MTIVSKVVGCPNNFYRHCRDFSRLRDEHNKTELGDYPTEKTFKRLWH